MVKLKGFRQINPYVAGQQPNKPDMIKLNTNENAYGPSPKVAEALQNFNAPGVAQVFQFRSGGALSDFGRPTWVYRPTSSLLVTAVTTSCPWLSWPSLTEASRSCFRI